MSGDMQLEWAEKKITRIKEWRIYDQAVINNSH